jgi:hypothetical protein
MKMGWILAGWMAVAAAFGQSGATLEMRTYTFASEAKLQAFAGYVEADLIPALNRAGCRPVGAFRMRAADNPKLELAADDLRMFILFSHPSPAAVGELAGKLDADGAHAAAFKALLGASAPDPVYARFETQLMVGFRDCRDLETPSKSDDRVIQLRIYESANDERALRKVEMFDQGGEIAIFRRVGLHPVFFGRSIAGTRLPNLTYALGFDSPAAMDAAWTVFRKDPAWITLKDDPVYKDTVSTIINWILRPLPGSQI